MREKHKDSTEKAEMYKNQTGLAGELQDDRQLVYYGSGAISGSGMRDGTLESHLQKKSMQFITFLNIKVC